MFKIFNTEKDFKDEAIIFVARLVFDNAVPVIMSGNVADDSERVLSYLLSMSREEKLSRKTQDSIAFYHRQIFDENQKMLKYR